MHEQSTRLENFLENVFLVSVLTAKHIELYKLNIERLKRLDILPSKIHVVSTNLSKASQIELENYLKSQVSLVEVKELNQKWINPNASLEHMSALNEAISECKYKSRFMWIMDPDFYIVSKENFQIMLEILHLRGSLLTPWSPRWIKKSRSVATAHFALIDISKNQTPLFENNAIKDFAQTFNTKVKAPQGVEPHLIWKAIKTKKMFLKTFFGSPKFRFLAKFRTRLEINSKTDTFLNLPLHMNYRYCLRLKDCQNEHLVHVVRKGIDVKKPKEFVFGLWWEAFIPKGKSIWPRKRNFYDLDPPVSEPLNSILDSGELMALRGVPCGWHLRSIGRAGGSPENVNYEHQGAIAKTHLQILESISLSRFCD